MAVSGKCYLSLHNHNTWLIVGACLQDCRRAYHVKDKESEVENSKSTTEFIHVAENLKTIQLLDKVLAAGVTVLKIEGRDTRPNM